MWNASDAITKRLRELEQHLQTEKNFQLDHLLKELERSYVEAALDITHGNLSKAARMLGIHRTTLYSRMQSYGQTSEEK